MEQYLDIVRYRAREDIRDEYLDFLIDHAAEQAASLLATKGYFNSRIMIIDDRTGKTVGTDAQLSARHKPPKRRARSGRSVELQDAGSEAETATPAVSKLPSYTIKVELGEQAIVRSAKLDMQGFDYPAGSAARE